MVSIQGQASARLTEFQEVAADPVNGYARASNLLALSAQLNDPVTGLPQTRADFSTFASAQATFNASTVSSLTSL
ncbi:hypothetical protein, partial [Raoultella ornithinolytica]|uniref:hypothetical protein n=1 Tax=Raoultella ornithinolytica TaxID=54291 RepID=UPI0013DA9A5F